MSVIVGLYGDLATAGKVVNDLKDHGYDTQGIHLLTHDNRAQQKGPGGFFQSLQDIFGRKPKDIGNAPTSLAQQLTDWGVPDQDAQQYSEAILRGNTLLMVSEDENRVDDAQQIMNRFNPTAISVRDARWQPVGTQVHDVTAQPLTEEERAQEPGLNAQPQAQEVESTMSAPAADVSDQELQSTGTAQAADVTHEDMQSTGVTEQPAEETQMLRDEAEQVNRQPAESLATDADMRDVSQEQTSEVHEVDEELIQDDQAQVTGEVVVGKTEVYTGDVRPSQMTTQGDFSGFDTDFRNHYDMLYANQGRQYSEYEPAYRYGYDVAGNDRYWGQKWSEIEPSARQDWERQQPGRSWNDFKDAIRYAWERASSAGQTGTTGPQMGTGPSEGYGTNLGEGPYADSNNP